MQRRNHWKPGKREILTEKDGSPGRIRTSDLTVNSRPLYRLSYRGARETGEPIYVASSWNRIKPCVPLTSPLPGGSASGFGAGVSHHPQTVTYHCGEPLNPIQQFGLLGRTRVPQLNGRCSEVGAHDLDRAFEIMMVAATPISPAACLLEFPQLNNFRH